MQRVRVTDQGLQASFGVDILTINHVNDPTMGDSYGFSYRGSLLNSGDIMHGQDYNKTGVFEFNGRDSVDLLIEGLDRLADRKATPPYKEPSFEITDFPEDSQSFYEYTHDNTLRVAAIGVSRSVARESIVRANPGTEELEKTLQIANILLERLSTFFGDLPGSGDTPDRPALEAFAYPLGIKEDDLVLLLAEQKNDSIKLTINNAMRERLTVPSFSMNMLTRWMRSNYNDPALKKKSIWG